MVTLYIDNIRADIDPQASLSISLSIASLSTTSWGRANYSKSITIPATPLNRRLMGDCEQPLSAEMFNHRQHTARVEVCGCVVIEGTIYLTASRIGREGYYCFNIIGKAREWVRSASQPLSKLVEDWSLALSSSTIDATLRASEGSVPVRFLPVARGTGEGAVGNIGRLLPENYHPFLHIGSMVDAIFARAGYAVESEFLRSEFFRSLYMSGRWSTKNYDGWLEEMDFRATRSEPSPQAVGNLFGRVYTDPNSNYNTLGNLVEMPTEETAEVFNSGSLAVDSTGRLCFTPTREVAVAFDYHLVWESEFYIRSREKLVAFTEIRPYYGDSHTISLPNKFVDRREGTLEPNFLYRLIIFEPVEGATYNLVAEEVSGDTGEVVTHTLASTTERSVGFSHSLSGTLGNLRVEMHHEGFIGSPASDWAIYDGYVSERGTRRLEANLRSAPERCSPTKPKYFDLFYFGGAEEGMKMRLLEGCSLRPVFYPHPTVGEKVQWSDVADYNISGLDLLAALRELFDLQIYTDTLARKVCIEPRSEYCDPGVVIDLSERIDPSKAILVEELGGDHPKRLTLRYRTGDRAVEEHKVLTGEPYGEWGAEIDNFFASEGERLISNRLFAPSIETRGSLYYAPSASLIRVGDVGRELPAEGGVVDCNFLPKIVSFRGMHPLPEGEMWSYPSVGDDHYPLVTFFDNGSLSGEPLSLLFEDRDGVVGLHRWWDQRVEALNHSRRLTLYLALRPEDIEQIVVPNSSKHDFRAHYLLTIEGEKVLCRMEEVVDYNPAAPSTKVVLTTI